MQKKSFSNIFIYHYYSKKKELRFMLFYIENYLFKKIQFSNSEYCWIALYSKGSLIINKIYV